MKKTEKKTHNMNQIPYICAYIQKMLKRLNFNHIDIMIFGVVKLLKVHFNCSNFYELLLISLPLLFVAKYKW